MKGLVMLLGVVLAFSVSSGTCLAADEYQDTKKEVESLKERISELEDRLGRMEPTEVEEKEGIDIGGALRFSYVYSEFDGGSKDRGGDFQFEIFRLDVNGELNDLLISAQYRWYSYQDVIHHGWMGYNFSKSLQGQIGVTQVPFGILPYASHSWWFGLPYYIGYEDDYDMGIKFISSRSPWDIQLAFFKNADWGNSSKLERYSFDVVKALGQDNEETNQLNARAAYTLDHGDLGSTELGLSGQWGQLRNDATADSGDHWAAAAHVNGFYGPFNLMLQAAYYQYNPENPPGISDSTVVIGGLATAYEVASEGAIYIANISYDRPVDWGPITKLTFYNDYSILDKEESDFESSQINTLGCLITAVPVYTYVDFIFGKNMVFLGGPSNALAEGGPDEDWHMRFNINFGYYF